MSKFRKKPVVIEAIQLTLHNAEEIESFVGGDLGRDSERNLVIATLEGAMRASVGDWIIKGVKGEFYPCKPDIFAATYEVVIQETETPTPSSSGSSPKDQLGTASSEL